MAFVRVDREQEVGTDLDPALSILMLSTVIMTVTGVRKSVVVQLGEF